MKKGRLLVAPALFRSVLSGFCFVRFSFRAAVPVPLAGVSTRGDGTPGGRPDPRPRRSGKPQGGQGHAESRTRRGRVQPPHTNDRSAYHASAGGAFAASSSRAFTASWKSALRGVLSLK